MTRTLSHETPEPDALDRAFSTFFKAQVPANWPAVPRYPQAVPSERQVVRGAGESSRARLTLAASIAVFFGLGFYLTSDRQQAAPTGTASEVNKNDAQADGSKLLPPQTPITNR